MNAVDDWDPLAFKALEGVFAGAPFRWWICGGLALMLHVGKSWRSPEDLDIGILRGETTEVYSWLSEWDLWVAARGTLTPWHGEPLDAERGENNIRVRDDADSPWRFDLTVGSGNDTEWIYRRDETVRRDWNAAVLRTRDGLSYLAPELQLLFKSKNPRPKDDLDAQQVLPQLDPDRLTFLTEHLPGDHHWRQLSETALDANALRTQVVAGLLRQGDQVLLCHRRADRSHYPDVWDLPGGGVEPDERLADALTRELDEKLGVTARLTGETPWLSLTDDTLQLHMYLIDDWQGEPINMAPNEHDDIRRVTIVELADLNLADHSYVEIDGFRLAVVDSRVNIDWPWSEWSDVRQASTGP